jgi:hypothetical protein
MQVNSFVFSVRLSIQQAYLIPWGFYTVQEDSQELESTTINPTLFPSPLRPVIIKIKTGIRINCEFRFIRTTGDRTIASPYIVPPGQ